MPSSSIGTRQHTSLAAAIVVQQLLGLVDGGEFLGSDLPAVLPLGRRTGSSWFSHSQFVAFSLRSFPHVFLVFRDESVVASRLQSWDFSPSRL